MFEIEGKQGTRPSRIHTIQVRVQPQLMDAVDTAAERGGMTRSEWIRNAMTEPARREMVGEGSV